MSSGLHSTIPMKGHLRVTVRDAVTGKRLRRIEIRNKITFLAADVLVELVAQRVADPAPSADRIFSMRMGTGNSPASRADTNLGAPVIGKQLDDVNKITGVPGELEFTATLEQGDANGSTLQEAGLFTAGDAGSPDPMDTPNTTPGSPRLFARQIHPPIPKSGAISVDYSWRIAFTA